MRFSFVPSPPHIVLFASRTKAGVVPSISGRGYGRLELLASSASTFCGVGTFRNIDPHKTRLSAWTGDEHNVKRREPGSSPTDPGDLIEINEYCDGDFPP